MRVFTQRSASTANNPTRQQNISLTVRGALFRRGCFSECIDYLLSARASTGADNPQRLILTHYNAACTYEEMSLREEAMAEMEQAALLTASEEYNALAQVGLAWILGKDGQECQSDQLFTTAEAIMPSESVFREQLYSLRGELRLQQNRLAEAQADLEAALKVIKVSPHVWWNLMLLAERCGDTAEVHRWRERLVQDTPESFYTARLRRSMQADMV